MRASLDDLRSAIGDEFDAGEAAQEVDTIGGYLVMKAGHVPDRGECHNEAASYHQRKSQKNYLLIAKAASDFSTGYREGNAGRKIKTDEKSDFTQSYTIMFHEYR